MRFLGRTCAFALACLCAYPAWALAASSAQAKRALVVDEQTVVDEPVIVDEPVFPGVIPRRPVRVWSGVVLAPEAEFGDTTLGFARPEIRSRVGLPLSARVNVQIAADFQASRYDVSGDEALFDDCSQCPAPDDFYATSLATQGGIRLNGAHDLFLAGEHWALLGALFTRARWEPGAFLAGVTPGGSLALGYQVPARLRLAVGARIERALDGDGVSIEPSIYCRWDIGREIQLKSRGLGATLEYAASQRLEVFVSGFQESDAFRLEDRPGLASGATFRDRRTLVGGGIILTVIHAIKLAAEAGAIVERRVAVRTRSEGILDDRDGDPSPYVALRAEARF